MYIRLYPIKNNTIFKKTTGTQLQTSGNINTGMNPIAEIMDGNGYSTVLMQFDLESIKDLLEKYPYTCNLKVWDAGTIFEPVIKLKDMDLFYFKEDFVEGDGFSFLDDRALQEVSNYNLRDSVNDWTGVFTTGQLPALHLNNANQDLIFENLQSFIGDAITNNVNPNFGFRISTNDVDGQTYTKFVHTRHTRTIYKPFLEFFIDNEIIDARHKIVATKPTKLYVKTPSGENFTVTPTVEIKGEDGAVIDTPTVTNPVAGVYYIDYTPDILYKNMYLTDVWTVDGEVVAKNLFEVKSPNSLIEDNCGGLFFYPTFSYTKPIIRQNDLVYFNVVSEIRGKGSYLGNYEYKVVCTNNFEMQPWTPVSLYKNQLYFTIDTSYYFPELEYEVFVRLVDGEKQIQTGGTSQKFRIVSDGPTHLQDRFTTPYQSRDYNFKR